MSNIPKNIKKQLMGHKTSLGDNPCYPPENELPFDYKIIQDSFNKLENDVKSIDNANLNDINSLKNLLSELITQCQDIETPIKNQLENICFNIINDMFEIPQDVIFECSLVGEVDSNGRRIVPDNTDDFDFDGIDEINELNLMVYKRRTINALIRGASIFYASKIEDYVSSIYKLNPKLPELYKKIISLNNYLVYFINDFKVMKSEKLSGLVDVYLGEEDESPKISSKGIVFPILLSESIKGFMELFASHSLPKDKKSALYVIKKSDFLLAEPWDIRLGIPLWEILQKNLDDKDIKILPLFLTEFFSLNTNKFNSVMKEILANTKKGRKSINMIFKHIFFEIKKDNFNDYIAQQNNNLSQINDGYFTINELNDFI